jgi:polysaccharide transporter, PST family
MILASDLRRRVTMVHLSMRSRWIERRNRRSLEDAVAEGAQHSMAGAVLTGFKWKIITILVSEGTRVAVVVVLARLLVPKDYGLAGMAFIFAGFVTLFSDVALGGALVQRRNIDERDRSTVFWASLVLSLVVMAAAIGLSGVVADFFGEPEVRNLIIVLSFTFPLAALSTTQTALLTRVLAYRSLELREIIGVLCGAVAALAFAFAGFGAYAIVANALTATAVSTVLLWRLSSWRPRATFSFRSLGGLGSFGLKLFGIRLLNYGNLNADNMLIGRFAGASALGIYSLAYNVMFTPMTRIATPIAGVVYPALVRMQDDVTRMRIAWLRSKRLSASLLAPTFLAIMVTAPDLVHVVFGAKWKAAVPVIQLLCIAGVAHSLQTLNFAVLQATGRVGTELRLDLGLSLVIIGAFAAGVPWGAVGVAAFFAGAKWLTMLIDTWVTTRVMSYDFWEALRAGGSTLPLAVLSAAAAYGARVWLVHEGVSASVRLFAVGAIALAGYLLLLAVAAPSLLAEARDVLKRRRQGAQSAHPGGVVATEQ